MLIATTARAAAGFPALARSFRGHLKASSRVLTVTTRASSAEQKQSGATQEKQGEQETQGGLTPQPPPPGMIRRRASPFFGGLFSPTSPFFDTDNEMARVLNELDMMRDAVFGHPDSVARIPDKLDFKCDILEKKNEFLITADLPGLSKDQVSITVDDDRRLHITAERASRHEEESSPGDDMKLHVYERSFGKIERMFRLPEVADDENVEASMKNGVLTVKVPKHPQEETEEKVPERKIKIK